jgi:hypothetical protein
MFQAADRLHFQVDRHRFSYYYNLLYDGSVKQMEISNEDLSHQQQLLEENQAEHMESNSNYHLGLIHLVLIILKFVLRLESVSAAICEPTSPQVKTTRGGGGVSRINFTSTRRKHGRQSILVCECNRCI